MTSYRVIGFSTLSSVTSSTIAFEELPSLNVSSLDWVCLGTNTDEGRSEPFLVYKSDLSTIIKQLSLQQESSD
ncbi:hypothetical protein LINPERHAP1_LOCUS19434 [Linum perenne]